MTVTTAARAAGNTMTVRQHDYIKSLISRITSEPVQVALKADLNTLHSNGLLSVHEASRQIDRIKAVISAQAIVAAQPVVEAPVAPVQPSQFRLPYPQVAASRYAVEVDGVLRFYNVTKSDDGNRTFVKRYMSDTLVRVTSGEAVRALRIIEGNPTEARMAFARETTRCFTCGRMLTDPESMDRGQGPDCAAKQ